MDLLGDGIHAQSAVAVPDPLAGPPPRTLRPLCPLLCVAVAVALVGVECQRRTSPSRVGAAGDSASVPPRRFLGILKRYVWEALGLAACTALASTLRSNGGLALTPIGPLGGLTAGAAHQGWIDSVTAQPPIAAADVLLLAQVLLRCLSYASAALCSRAVPGKNEPLAGVVSALLLEGQLCRIGSLCGGRTQTLGKAVASTYLFLEVLCLMPLATLGPRSAFWTSRANSVVAALVLCLGAGRLWLPHGFAFADALFWAAHALELLAAFTHLAHTVGPGGGLGGIHATATHLALPLQQGLAAYCLVEAPSTTRQLVVVGAVAQLGAYVAATALRVAEYCDGDGEERGSPSAAWPWAGQIAVSGLGTVVRPRNAGRDAPGPGWAWDPKR